ncbi:MAG: lytic transglycosylase domain-containing protein [Betaproteobacteria bacterium]|nr:lytic transglycosylase domain-containing protein [Betaproteobacteria bacterium]
MWISGIVWTALPQRRALAVRAAIRSGRRAPAACAAIVICAALWLAGCAGLPQDSGNVPAPQVPAPQLPAPPRTPAAEEAPPRLSPVEQERALATEISRTWFVGNQRAARIVRAASQASRHTTLPRTLILAIIAVESSFNTLAVSPVGARGLMQVLPEAHPEKVERIGGEHMLHDVDTGIHVGARILHEYRRVTGNLRAALRRYSGAARNYADKVLKHKEHFDLVQARGSVPITLQFPWPEDTARRDDHEPALRAWPHAAAADAWSGWHAAHEGPDMEGDEVIAPLPPSPPQPQLAHWSIPAARRPSARSAARGHLDQTPDTAPPCPTGEAAIVCTS